MAEVSMERRIRQSHAIPFTSDEDVVSFIHSRCTELQSGGRMIDAILANALLPGIRREFLTRSLDGIPAEKIHISAGKAEFVYGFRQSTTKAAKPLS